MAKGSKVTLVVAAIVAVVLVIVLAVGPLGVFRHGDRANSEPRTTAPRADRGTTTQAELEASTAPATMASSRPAPIRAGILLSHFTATGPSWNGRPYTLRDLPRLLAPLSTDPEIQMIPLIEPGTAFRREVGEMLDEYFPDAKPVNATDKAALAKLDVIILYQTWNMQQRVTDAVEAAVTGGVGYMQMSGPGLVTPQYNEQLGHLNAVKRPQYAWSFNPNVACVVLAEHPLLGTLRKGDRVMLSPNGLLGEGIEMPLLQVTDDKKLRSGGTEFNPEFHFYPLYVGHCGKGTVIGCGWSCSMELPQELDLATRGRFYPRAVRWLAGRKID